MNKPVPCRGWRKVVNLSAITTLLILVVNISFAVVAHSKFDAEDGVGVIYYGNCDIVKRWNTALHLLINFLATALLASSSYTMQCLNSPTRGEIDTAHRDSVSLDIGLLSMRNFKYMRPWRTFTWLLLFLSTLPLHLLWNSTIIMTSGANLFNYVIADDSFLHGASYMTPYPNDYYCSGSSNLTIVISDIYDGYRAGNFANITAEQCFDHYVNGDGIAYRNVVMIAKRTPGVDMTPCGYHYRGWDGSAIIGVDTNVNPTGSLLVGLDSLATNDDRSAYLDKIRRSLIATGTWQFNGYQIERCLSEIVGIQQCRLQYVSYILYVVIVCNLIKFVCILAASYYLWDPNEPILATVGDAVVSFLARRDITTAGSCILDFRDLLIFSLKAKGEENQRNQSRLPIFSNAIFMNGPLWSEDNSDIYKTSIYSRTASTRLISATSRRRWFWTMFICWIYTSSGFVFWLFSTASGKIAMAKAMSSKFGAVNPEMLLGIEGASGSRLLFNIILANFFQLALSTTYYLYNALYTAQCAALEWASFGRGRPKSLRVTWPKGQQRSTYYLQLPWRYAIPLTVFLAIMHFLVSESIFLARMVYYDPKGRPMPHLGYMTVGYSPPAVLTASCVSVLMLSVQVVNAWQPLDNTIPKHGNKSIVISALCHAEKNEDRSDESQLDMTTKPLKWGVTRQPRRNVETHGQTTYLGEYIPGHCTFSAQIIGRPKFGSRYF